MKRMMNPAAMCRTTEWQVRRLLRGCQAVLRVSRPGSVCTVHGQLTYVTSCFMQAQGWQKAREERQDPCEIGGLML